MSAALFVLGPNYPAIFLAATLPSLLAIVMLVVNGACALALSPRPLSSFSLTPHALAPINAANTTFLRVICTALPPQ